MTYQDNNMQRIPVFPILFTAIIDIDFRKLDVLIRRVNTGEFATAYTSTLCSNWTILGIVVCFDSDPFRVFGMSIIKVIGICNIWRGTGCH